MEPSSSTSSWIDSSLSLGLNLTPHPKIQVKRAGELAEELSRVSNENRKLTEMLSAMWESYNALHSQFADLMNKTTTMSAAVNKRKSPESCVQTDQSSSSSDDDSNLFKKPRENSCGVNGNNGCPGGGLAVAGVIKRKASDRVLVKTDKSDTSLIVKDGYQWRKYGQKVTRDNPSPRAYFKCSFAPTCQVKKKVQRSAEDQTMLVATYDGEHNHLPPSEIELSANRGSNLGLAAANSVCSSTISPSKPTVTLDLIKAAEDSKVNMSGSGPVEIQGRPEFQQFIVEQMASSLTQDPGFKAALAAAISGRMMDGSNMVAGKWL